MASADAARGPAVYTVGHSNQSLEEFLKLLARHQIQVVVDTRSHPYSKYVAQFNREALQASLKQAGFKYLFLGVELGGRPAEKEYFDDEGHVLYYRLAQSRVFLGGIERVEAGSRQYRVALLCSEEDPGVCHRHLLVGRVLAERGHDVQHIRSDGSVQAFADVPVQEQEQPLLFDLPGMNPWKSLRSVLPKKPRPSSSGSSEDTASNA